LNNNIPNILLTNILSLRNKVDELQLVVEHNSADIVSLTETWLSDDILTDEISIPGYNFFRSDRQDR
jgi:exonuclease III